MTIRLLCVGLWFAAVCNGAQAQVFTYDCLALGGTNCTARILDGPQNAITSTIQVPAARSMHAAHPAAPSGVQLNITHNWVGDLQASVTNPNAVTAALLNNLASPGGSVGGCQSDDVNAVFQDGAPAASCGLTIPAVSGTVAPVSALLPLALANGAPPGTWTLTLADTANSNDGALNDWAVQAPVIHPRCRHPRRLISPCCGLLYCSRQLPASSFSDAARLADPARESAFGNDSGLPSVKRGGCSSAIHPVLGLLARIEFVYGRMHLRAGWPGRFIRRPHSRLRGPGRAVLPR